MLLQLSNDGINTNSNFNFGNRDCTVDISFCDYYMGQYYEEFQIILTTSIWNSVSRMYTIRENIIYIQFLAFKHNIIQTK